MTGGDAMFWTVSNAVWVVGAIALIGLLASFGWRFHSVAKLNRRLTDQTTIRVWFSTMSIRDLPSSIAI